MHMEVAICSSMEPAPMLAEDALRPLHAGTKHTQDTIRYYRQFKAAADQLSVGRSIGMTSIVELVGKFDVFKTYRPDLILSDGPGRSPKLYISSAPLNDPDQAPCLAVNPSRPNRKRRNCRTNAP